MDKKNLLISFSGGRTSAYMTHLMLKELNYQDKYNIQVVFANTGKEHEGTLEFVERCSKEWGIDIVWIESTHKNDQGDLHSTKGWRVGHKVVDFKTASRNGEPFEEMMSVLGIPCSAAPFCSDQLKRKSIESYLKEIGFKKFYKAIGIRSDEIDRVNEKYKEKRILYPLITDKATTKVDIKQWWKNNTFDLSIPENLGNCDVCWKKSFSVLASIAKDEPSRFDWWEDQKEKYKDKSRTKKDNVSFYRGGKTKEDIFDMVDKSEEEVKEIQLKFKLDGCSESCEVYK
jgi:hypothetical protein